MLMLKAGCGDGGAAYGLCIGCGGGGAYIGCGVIGLGTCGCGACMTTGAGAGGGASALPPQQHLQQPMMNKKNKITTIIAPFLWSSQCFSKRARSWSNSQMSS